jgi:FkbM family methyltransferase
MQSPNLGTIFRRSESLAADDRPFRHYSLRHRAIAWISRHLFDHCTYTVRHGLIRGMRRKGGLGWLPASAQTKEEMFWRDLPLNGLVVYDVGACHGILTMFFAARCKQVICYEPNEINCARLTENIRLNRLGNVQVRPLGVGAQPGSATFHYAPEMAGGGTLDPHAMGSVSQRVEVSTLDHDIAALALPAPDLIKIDIEGWELEALDGARETLAARHPALFLEMHGETMREKRSKARAIIGFLCDAGYTDIRHVETGAAIAPGDETMAAEGHLYCLCPTNTSSRLRKGPSA